MTMVWNLIIAIQNAALAHKTINLRLRLAGIKRTPRSSRLFFSILLFSLTKYPDQYLATNEGRFKIDTELKKRLARRTALMCGWVILMAYDDFVDENNLQSSMIFDQLSRCLAVFLAAQPGCEPPTGKNLKKIGEIWKTKAALWEVLPIPSPLNQSLYDFNFLENSNKELALSDFLYKTAEKEFNNQINITIISAAELGKIHAQTRREIADALGNIKVTEWNLDFLLMSLTRAAWGQIYSPLQRDLNHITWKIFINIGYNKSNCFIDGLDCLRNIVDQKRFFRTRFNPARFCEQFLDDVQDYFSDVNKGVAGYFHAEFIFQGQLAGEIIDRVYDHQASGQEKVNRLKKLLREHSYSMFYENTFCCFNHRVTPYWEDGNFNFDTNNIDDFLSALMMKPSQAHSDITRLLREKKDAYRSFLIYWKSGNFQKCGDLLIESEIPTVMARSFATFIIKNKEVLKSFFKKNSDMSVFWVYYLTIIGIMKIFEFRIYLETFQKHFLHMGCNRKGSTI